MTGCDDVVGVEAVGLGELVGCVGVERVVLVEFGEMVGCVVLETFSWSLVTCELDEFVDC